MSETPRLRRAGERAVLIELDDNEAALALAADLRARLGRAAEDIVPGHRTLLVSWPAGAADLLPRLSAELRRARDRAVVAEGPQVELAVHYDGPDLELVAEWSGLRPAQVSELHSAATYRVAFLGFAPGFAYLLGGDPQLQVPRRPEPRPRVAAGSVALAGPYTAVYPCTSPGGWQLIGTVDATMFDLARRPPALLTPGALVRFVPARRP